MENNNSIDPITETRINGLYERFFLIRQRLFYLILYLVTVPIIIAIALYAFFSHSSRNLYNEKADLREYKKELREDVGKTKKEPLLELFGIDGKPLENQTLSLKINIKYQNDGKNKYSISIPYVTKNVGKKTTGKMSIKLYTKRFPISLNPSTDEPDFNFETYINPGSITPQELPGGGFSLSWRSNIYFDNKEEILGNDSALLKIYYGDDKIVSAKFNILIDK